MRRDLPKQLWCVARRLVFAAATCIAATPIARGEQPAGQGPEACGPEERAIQYLSREVPRWSAENNCFSCHNNGDAARALYSAKRLGYSLPQQALADTSRFLTAPAAWEQNGPEGPFSDKRLARIQFAAALASAAEAKQVQDRAALVSGAVLLADLQEPDGSWSIDTAEAIGSPVTYGRPLATAIACETLRSADAARFRGAIEKAEQWLARLTVQNTLDAAAVLLAGKFEDREDSDQRQHAVDLLRRGQSADGGWGPYVTAPPENFDTALTLLALARIRDEPGVRAMIERGREYLVSQQLADGSWLETTRPSGAESYAQRLSTTGWATQALLATRDMR